MEAAEGYLHSVAQFQSHIGAIRMGSSQCQFSCTKRYFNPTLVQLESFDATSPSARLLNFNPTLVQLEFLLKKLLTGLSPDFNPTLVQLE